YDELDKVSGFDNKASQGPCCTAIPIRDGQTASYGFVGHWLTPVPCYWTGGLVDWGHVVREHKLSSRPQSISIPKFLSKPMKCTTSP
ncbi:hypothetical protein J6590_104739, partial [Homalodisca vitripennis]